MSFNKSMLILVMVFSLMGHALWAKEPGLTFDDQKSAELVSIMSMSATGSLLAQNSEGTEVVDSAKVVPFEIIKKPGRALLFSAIIPGTGEIYAESYIVGASLIAVEAALWVFYSKFHSKGKDLETEFEAFANAHWREDAYKDWIERNPETSITHELPETKTQQYYEMIGKYHQFYAGWDDSEGYVYNGAEISPNRKKYMDMREDSNIQLKNATTMASVAMLNHILSAVNAAWTTYRYNKNYAQRNTGTSLQFDTIQYANQFCPALSLNMRW